MGIIDIPVSKCSARFLKHKLLAARLQGIALIVIPALLVRRAPPRDPDVIQHIKHMWYDPKMPEGITHPAGTTLGASNTGHPCKEKLCWQYTQGVQRCGRLRKLHDWILDDSVACHSMRFE